MEKKYSDKTIQEILSTPIGDSDVIDRKVQEAYEQIRRQNGTGKRQVKKMWWSIGKGLGAMAAVFALVFTVCLTNPVWASGIPIIGSIFERIQEWWAYGEVPEEEIVSLVTETEEKEITPYQVTAGGLTFSITEYYATNQGIFLGFVIESEDPLPGLYEPAENGMEVQLVVSEKYSFRGEWTQAYRMLEGVQIDEYTYEGIMRIDAGEEELPEQFEMDLKIEAAYFYYLNEDKTAARHDSFVIDGSFSSISIERSDKDTRTISVDEINESGVGLKSIELSPVEVTLNPINTRENEGLEIFTVVLDANGRKLEYGSSYSSDSYAIGEKDISTLYVYVCEWDEYMEIKGLVLEEDTSLFQNALEECALYKKVINTEE